MRRFYLILIVFFALGVIVESVSAMTSRDPFPVHASMRPNVEFWKKIYSEFPSTKGVLHDSKKMDIIYEVIDLKPHGPGSSRVNSERVKMAKERYLAMLDKFARGEAPSTQLECRIYALFGPDPKRHEFRQAREDIRCQTGQKDMFLAGVKRSGKYLERIKDIFRSQGLPEDLAYLPHVESSYNYEAYSKFGAAGIWQFTRSTGQRFMQVDYVVDERRDPIAATYAAAKFLKQNHDLLGDWPLALTAYNHGPNGMLRAKKEKGTYPRIFDEYDGARFKFASRNFYSEYIAARHVAKNFRLYFGNVDVDQPVLYHSIEMEGYAPVASICNFFHVGVDEIKSVNPALRSPVFDGQKHIPKGYRLRLPGHSQKMARMSTALPSSLFERGQKRSNFYRVQRGDTAGKIAKRHNVSINELAAANGLSRRATIYVGQNLRIPAGGEYSTMLASATSSSNRSPAVPTMAILKEKVLAKATVQEKSSSPVVGSLAKWRPRGNPQGLIAAREDETPPPSLVARAEKKVVEALKIPILVSPEEKTAVPEEISVLAQAETVAVDLSEMEPLMVVAEVAQQPRSVLGEIVEFVLPAPDVEAELLSEMAEAPQEDLVFAENEILALASDVVEEEERVGAEVEFSEAVEIFEALEAAEVVNPLVLVGNFDVSKMKTVKGTATGTIQVEVEETLGHYADWLGIPTQNIRHLNSYRYGKPIQYGQKLKLPFAKVSKEDFEERRYLYHKEMVEDFFVAYKIEGDKTYRVKKGDNLWTLCHDAFDLPFWLIKQYNSNFDFHALRLGSEIKVPMVSKIDSDSQVAEVNHGSLPGKPLAKRISAKKLATQ